MSEDENVDKIIDWVKKIVKSKDHKFYKDEDNDKDKEEDDNYTFADHGRASGLTSPTCFTDSIDKGLDRSQELLVINVRFLNIK